MDSRSKSVVTNQDQYRHKSVLLDETLSLLNIKPNGIYLDGTFGRGGHARAILQRLGTNGKLFACDKDIVAVDYAKNNLQDERFTILHSSFAQVNCALKKQVVSFDGVLLDLGVSSPQLDDATRGFSLRFDGFLDMRMDTSFGITASEWLNTVSEEDLATVLWRYGEERFSRRIAKNIVLARKNKAITHTEQLAQIIASSIPGHYGKQHKATRSFQAIRIFINHELDDLHTALDVLSKMLNVNGRMVVISFHSLEDRMVKTKFAALTHINQSAASLPKWVMMSNYNVNNHAQYKVVAKKVRPAKQESDENPRSRSAILRCVERITLD